MIINGQSINNIGYIRPKQLPGATARYELRIYPPPHGLLNDQASLIESEVDGDELARIAAVAPQLLRDWPPNPDSFRLIGRPTKRLPKRNRQAATGNTGVA